MAGEVAAHHHFHWISLALDADAHIRVRHFFEPVGHDVGSGIQEVGGDLVQYLTFIRDSTR